LQTEKRQGVLNPVEGRSLEFGQMSLAAFDKLNNLLIVENSDEIRGEASVLVRLCRAFARELISKSGTVFAATEECGI
jgi:hypothetical protein